MLAMILWTCNGILAVQWPFVNFMTKLWKEARVATDEDMKISIKEPTALSYGKEMPEM